MNPSEFFSWLFFYAITILHLTEEMFWDSTQGEVVTLLNINNIYNGEATEEKEVTIDDIIPI